MQNAKSKHFRFLHLLGEGYLTKGRVVVLCFCVQLHVLIYCLGAEMVYYAYAEWSLKMCNIELSIR